MGVGHGNLWDVLQCATNMYFTLTQQHINILKHVTVYSCSSRISLFCFNVFQECALIGHDKGESTHSIIPVVIKVSEYWLHRDNNDLHLSIITLFNFTNVTRT